LVLQNQSRDVNHSPKNDHTFRFMFEDSALFTRGPLKILKELYNSQHPWLVEKDFIRLQNKLEKSICSEKELEPIDENLTRFVLKIFRFHDQFTPDFRRDGRLKFKLDHVAMDGTLDTLSTAVHQRDSNGSNRNYVLTLWVLDTDGLVLNNQILNHSGYTSVNPMNQLINTKEMKNKALRKKFLYYQDPAAGHQNSDVWDSQIILRHGVDHIVAHLNPNLELFEKSKEHEHRQVCFKNLSSQNMVRSRSASGMRNNSVDTPAQLHLNLAFIGTAPRHPDERISMPRKRESNLPLLIQRFCQLDVPGGLAAPVISFPVSREEMQEYFEIPDEFASNYLAGAAYLRKNGQTFPLQETKKPLNAEQFEDLFSSSLTLRKWTIYPTGEKGSRRNTHLISTAWSDANVCNAKTKIKLSDCSSETRDKFGTGFDGYKPCEMRVKGHLRCHHHRPRK
jgi:hypothetical protein